MIDRKTNNSAKQTIHQSYNSAKLFLIYNKKNYFYFVKALAKGKFYLKNNTTSVVRLSVSAIATYSKLQPNFKLINDVLKG